MTASLRRLTDKNVLIYISGNSAAQFLRVQELCESRRGRPGLPISNSPYGLCGRKATLNLNTELRSCVKVDVAVLGSPSLTVLMVSVDVKQH